MKNISFYKLILILIGITVLPLPALAVTASPSPKPTLSPKTTTSTARPLKASADETTETTPTPKTRVPEDLRTKTLTDLKTIGTEKITNREAALNKALSAFKANKKISAANLTTLTTEITTLLNQLASQKTALNAATTVKDAKAVIKQTYETTRVFAIALPKLYHLAAAYQLSNAIALTKSKTQNLEALLATLSTQTTTSSETSSLFLSYKNNLASAETKVASAITALSSISSTTQSSSTALQSAVTSLKNAREFYINAGKDLKSLIALIRPTKSPSPSTSLNETKTVPAKQATLNP